MESGVLCNIGYQPETHLKLKSHKNSFTYKLFISYPIVSKFWTEHSSTAVLCTKFWNDWTTEVDVMDKSDLGRFELKMRFGQIYYYAQHTCYWMQYGVLIWHDGILCPFQVSHPAILCDDVLPVQVKFVPEVCSEH